MDFDLKDIEILRDLILDWFHCPHHVCCEASFFSSMELSCPFARVPVFQMSESETCVCLCVCECVCVSVCVWVTACLIKGLESPGTREDDQKLQNWAWR